MATHKVSLIGPPASGKTFLFSDIVRGIEDKHHGYPAKWGLKINPLNRGYVTFARSTRRDDPEKTLNARLETFNLYRHWGNWEDVRDSVQPSFSAESEPTGSGLGFSPSLAPDRDGDNLQMEVRDAPGDALFAKTDAARSGYTEELEEQAKYFDQNDGVVLVQNALSIRRPEGISEVIDMFDMFFSGNSETKFSFSNLKRVVIAVNMFDLLLLRYGPYALDIATSSEHVRTVLRSHLSDVRDEIRDFNPNNQEKEKIEVRIMATSSYGFLPRFGCSNVNPYSAELSDSEGPRRLDRRVPYLTADPFIYAATGLPNEFMFTPEELHSDD